MALVVSFHICTVFTKRFIFSPALGFLHQTKINFKRFKLAINKTAKFEFIVLTIFADVKAAAKITKILHFPIEWRLHYYLCVTSIYIFVYQLPYFDIKIVTTFITYKPSLHRNIFRAVVVKFLFLRWRCKISHTKNM